MRLAELQAGFQTALLNEPRVAPDSILASAQQSATERFAIYHEAYRLRLGEFLCNDYPVLRSILGDEGFAALAQAYIDANPSSHRNARWYGAGLPDFMHGHAPWQGSCAADVALFESALTDAFDAVDVGAIEASALAAVSIEDQTRLRFIFQPGLTVLSLAQGVTDAYEAVMGGFEIPPPSGGADAHVLVWRDRSLQACYRELEDDEALALDSARDGGSFPEVCGLLGLRMSEAEAATKAAQFLVQWFGDGLIVGLNLNDRA